MNLPTRYHHLSNSASKSLACNNDLQSTGASPSCKNRTLPIKPHPGTRSHCSSLPAALSSSALSSSNRSSPPSSEPSSSPSQRNTLTTGWQQRSRTEPSALPSRSQSSSSQSSFPAFCSGKRSSNK